MPHKLRRFTCVGCGRPAVKRADPCDAVFCQVCGIARSAQLQRDMHARSGPFYEAFLIGRARAAVAALYAYGLDVDRIVAEAAARAPRTTSGATLVGSRLPARLCSGPRPRPG